MLAEAWRLTDKVAIVTGGGGGIGRAIALAFAEAGADVVIADIVPERCEEAAERVRELGRTPLARPTDCADSAQVRAMIAEADARFGRVDILVNNVGGVRKRPFLETTEGSWQRHIDLNFTGMLAATQAAVPIMIRGGRGGSIVNIASIEGTRAAPHFAVYAACKAAMLNFTQTMSVELSPHRIRVNAITPDYTETPGVRGNITGPVDKSKWVAPSDKHMEAVLRRIPLGYVGIAEDVGRAALFLASEMSRYTTGATLPVDGGTSASLGWTLARSGDWVLQDDGS